MEKPFVKILLVDDQTMYSESVKIALEMQPDFLVTALAKDGYDAIEKADNLNPDVILMDISMKGMDGIETTEKLLQKNKDRKIIIVSTYSNRSFISKSIRMGISGYVLKDEGVNALINAITIVNKGGEYFSPEVTKVITDLYRKNEYTKKNPHSNGDSAGERNGKTAGDAELC